MCSRELAHSTEILAYLTPAQKRHVPKVGRTWDTSYKSPNPLVWGGVKEKAQGKPSQERGWPLSYQTVLSNVMG